MPKILGWDDQGLALDVAAHIGTLGAVVFYFRKELQKMCKAWLSSGFSYQDPEGKFVWFLLVATLPVGAAGFFGSDIISRYYRDPLVIATATILFGLVLWWTDKSGVRSRDEISLNWRDVLIIGLMQTLALIPGTSRSGITITAGLILGLDRESASRFSFLLSIPVIILAGGYEAYNLVSSPFEVEWIAFLTVILASCVTATLTMHFFLKFLKMTGLTPYVIYRILLGLLLIYLYI